VRETSGRQEMGVMGVLGLQGALGTELLRLFSAATLSVTEEFKKLLEMMEEERTFHHLLEI